MKRTIAYALLIACMILAIFVVYINIDAVIGAFGGGPPYYDRTTNMDKWENPIPTLIVLDVIVFLVVFFTAKWAYRRIK